MEPHRDFSAEHERLTRSDRLFVVGVFVGALAIWIVIGVALCRAFH